MTHTSDKLNELRQEYAKLNIRYEDARRQAWQADTKRQRTAASRRAGRIDAEKRQAWTAFLQAGGSYLEPLC